MLVGFLNGIIINGVRRLWSLYDEVDDEKLSLKIDSLLL